MIRFENITHYVADRTLFRELNWHIRPLERIGLVGDNGSGKTTLLRMAAGEIEPVEGNVLRRNRIRIGYLKQEFSQAEQVGTVLDLVLGAWAHEQEAAEEFTELCATLPQLAPSDHDRALMRLHELQLVVRHQNLAEVEAEAKKLLAGLGFKLGDMNRPLAEFSGGWQMRAALARLLLERPDVLLLDEPTNHLDLESTQWLLDFLGGYSGTLIVVSHDRYFLDAIVNKVAWLTRRQVRVYTGNYSAFLRKKEEEEEQLLRAHEIQQREIARTERFIERFRYKATKAAAVQSRIKMLEKIERIELPDATAAVRLRIPPPVPANKIVFELRHVCKSYGNQPLFSNVSLHCDFGDKIAVVGKNGSGKSTFLRICAGCEKFEGQRILSPKTRIAHFSQSHAESLNMNATVLEEAGSWAPSMTEEQLRTFLGAFLFRGDDVFKPVRVLSGGEKSRLALARVLLTPANVLLLDEPTNHLDITTRRILLEALQAYEGTVLFVSHDRFFLEQLATKVLSLEDGIVKLYYGNYASYLTKCCTEQGGPSAAAQAPTASRRNPTSVPLRSNAPRKDEERRMRTHQRLKVKKDLDHLQREIEQLETRLSEIRSLQADPQAYVAGRVTAELCAEAVGIEKKLPELIREWEHLVEEYEEIRSAT